MPGLKVHPKRSQDERTPPPLHMGSGWCWGMGWGARKRRGEGEGEDDKHGKEIEPKEALAAAEGIKWNIKRISQLGIVPAKKFSLLIKKIKLTSLSLATGGESPFGGGWLGCSALVSKMLQLH